MIQAFLKTHLITILGIGVGAIAGFFYWQQIGCVSGTCAITSNPVNSTLYGAVMGGLVLNSFSSEKKSNQEQQEKIN